MTTQETTEPKKRGRKPKTLAEQVRAEGVSLEQGQPVKLEEPTRKSIKDTLSTHLERVELLIDRRTDKEARAILRGLAMGLKAALRQGVLVERSGRFYLETSTDEA